MANWRGKSLWSVSSRFANAGLALLVNVLLTRTLSRNDTGLFFLSVSIAWGGALVCQWGASILAVKWVATARARQDLIGIRKAVWSLIFFTIMQGIVISLLFLFVPKPLHIRLIWSLWVFAVSLQTLLPEILRGFDDLKWASLLSGPIPQLFNFAVLGFAFVFWKHASFAQVALLTIVASAVTSSIGLALIFSRAPLASVDFGSYRFFLRESTPIGLSLASTYILSQADLWVCGTLLAREDVAIYGIAQRFTAFVSMPLMIFGSVATPTIAELFAKGDLESFKKVVTRGTFITSLCALATFFVGMALGWPALRYLFGVDYTAAYPVFLILGFGQVLHAVAGPNGYILLLCGEQHAAMFATAISAVVLFVCALIGARLWGVQGVAYASTFALTVQSIWMWWQVRSRMKLKSHFNWRENWDEKRSGA